MVGVSDIGERQAKRDGFMVRRCAVCRIPITSATAEGREDEFTCDKCLNEIADQAT